MPYILDACSNCGQRMRLTHTTPKSHDLPEFQSWKCYFCNAVTTIAAPEFTPKGK
jgi:hypothetical protein